MNTQKAAAIRVMVVGYVVRRASIGDHDSGSPESFSLPLALSRRANWRGPPSARRAGRVAGVARRIAGHDVL
jgi:hypothetical protein